jgi:hypothetical protein
MSVGQMVFRPNGKEPYWGHMLPFRSFYRSLAIREKERRRHLAFAIFKISRIITDFNKELNLNFKLQIKPVMSKLVKYVLGN